MSHHNSFRIDQSFESSGYIWFPFIDSNRKYLATISYDPAYGCIIDVKYHYFEFDSICSIFNYNSVTIGGLFERNLFLYSSKCEIPDSDMVRGNHSGSSTWMKVIRFFVNYFYLEDYKQLDSNQDDRPDYIFVDPDNPSRVSGIYVKLDNLHGSYKLPTIIYNPLDFLFTAKNTKYDSYKLWSEFREAAREHIISISFDEFEFKILNQINYDYGFQNQDNHGLTYVINKNNGYYTIDEIVNISERIRYLFVILFGIGINYKYISLSKDQSRSEIRLIKKFINFDSSYRQNRGFSLDELHKSELLAETIKNFLNTTDDFIFFNFIQPILYIRHSENHDYHTKILLYLTKFEGLYKLFSKQDNPKKVYLYDALIYVLDSIDNCGLFPDIISSEFEPSNVKEILVSLRNRLVHEGILDLSSKEFCHELHQLIYNVFEFFLLHDILKMPIPVLQKHYRLNIFISTDNGPKVLQRFDKLLRAISDKK